MPSARDGSQPQILVFFFHYVFFNRRVQNALYCKGDSLLDEEEKLLHRCFSLNWGEDSMDKRVGQISVDFLIQIRREKKRANDGLLDLICFLIIIIELRSSSIKLV